MSHTIRQKIPATRPWQDAGDARKLWSSERTHRRLSRLLTEVSRLGGRQSAAKQVADIDGDNGYDKRHTHRLLRRAARSWTREMANV